MWDELRFQSEINDKCLIGKTCHKKNQTIEFQGAIEHLRKMYCKQQVPTNPLLEQQAKTNRIWMLRI
jgi:NAD-dependent SIR2 family protein deacetylase